MPNKGFPVLKPSSKMPFGKYKGAKINDILIDDYKYIKWLNSNTDVKFNEEVMDSLSKMVCANEFSDERLREFMK